VPRRPPSLDTFTQVIFYAFSPECPVRLHCFPNLPSPIPTLLSPRFVYLHIRGDLRLRPPPFASFPPLTLVWAVESRHGLFLGCWVNLHPLPPPFFGFPFPTTRHQIWTALRGDGKMVSRFAALALVFINPHFSCLIYPLPTLLFCYSLSRR